MATKRLAKELGLLRQRSSSTFGLKKQLVSNQIFSYIIVIDFESTCWKEKNNYGQEIIEFPAVLLNTSTGEVESEFHSFVQPQEHPILSDFCTELTGITQGQVEAGLPLQICLSRFSRWIQTLQHQKGLVFPNAPQQSVHPPASNKLCTFLTWSDWDLGVCLLYECKRKQIHKPQVLNSWIDLRSTYKMFYNRKPKGLNGALQDLGIQFEGREHSGLDDARNTAQLAARMTRDGCVLRITRSLDRKPITSIKASPATKEPVERQDTKDRVNTNKSPTSTSIYKPSFNVQTPTLNPTKISVQSLVSPKTVLNGTITLAEACKTSATSTNLSTITVNTATSDSGGCVPFPQPSDTLEGPFEELIVEGEERCSSYDDVVLDDVMEDYSESESPSHTSEESLYHCARKQSLTTSGILRKSEISYSNLCRPQVLVPNMLLMHKPSNQSFSSFTERENPHSSRSHICNNALSNLSTNTFWNRISGGPFDELIVESYERCSSYDDVVLDDLIEDCSEFERASHSLEESTYAAKFLGNSSSSCITHKNIKGEAKLPGLKRCLALPKTVSGLRQCTQKESARTSALSNNSEISFMKVPKPRVLVPNTPLIHKSSKQSFLGFTEQEDSHSSKPQICSNVLPNLSTNTSLNRTPEGPFNELLVECEERGTYLDDVTEDFSELESASHTSKESNYAAKLVVNLTSNCRNAKKPGLERCFDLPKMVSILQHCDQKESPTTFTILKKSEIPFRNLPKPQILVPNTPSMHKPSKQSFSIFTEQEDSRSSKSHISTSVLSNLSMNTSRNRTSIGGVRRGECRITSPLCLCGRRAKRQLVSNGGPNQGRAFFCCPMKCSGGGKRAQKRCDFFKWESTLLPKSDLGMVAAAGSSVSLCQSRTLVNGQVQRNLRKSF